MKTFFCLLLFVLTTNISHSETFVISSFYYIDSAPKPNQVDSKVVFTVDRELTCDGNVTNKIFINKNSKSMGTTPYLLARFWPSYFFKQAAAVGAEIDADFSHYDPDLNACEVGFRYEGGSTERWYEPHEFKVSDDGDSKPINKVYYQLYINARSPTYAPWVYADTEYSVTCDGVTTNRVIPTTNPNEWGSVIPKEFGSQVDSSYSSENTRSFFDLLSGKIDHYSVGRYVPELDGCMIYDVVFSKSDSSIDAIKIGKQQCIDDPELCGLFSKDELDLALQLGQQNGIQQCIDDPELCGLFSKEELDLALQLGQQDGIQQCIDSPELCGLFNQDDVDEVWISGEEIGKLGCITDPESCNLFDLGGVNAIVEDNVSDVIKEIVALLPKGQVNSICKKSPGVLICDYISVGKEYTGHDKYGHDKHGHDKHDHDKHDHDKHGHDKHGHDKHGHDKHGQDKHGHDKHGHHEHGHDKNRY